MDSVGEEKILASNLLSAAARHDINAVRNLLRSVSANVQDNSTGYTPLHAAVVACKGRTEEPETLAAQDEETSQLTELLLANGAIWNDLDNNDETPGCIAFRLKLRKTYKLIVDAGIRAEVLLSKLEELNEPDDDDTENEEGCQSTGVAVAPSYNTEPLLSRDDQFPPPDDYIDHWKSNSAFLRSTLRYTDTTLLDHSSNAVMMDWETEIMNRHAATLLPVRGLRAMNIGHGMGIVDTAIQTHRPSEHHIVEAHPAVLEQMREKGWFEKQNGIVLDAIYYDTFAEDYKDLKNLFSEHVIGLLDQSGKFGFYNGMGADRQISYDVYQGVVGIDLEEAGFATKWEDVSVPTLDWKGIRRPYWAVPVYRLPTCVFA